MRGFWKVKANHVIAKLMGDLLEYAVEIGSVIKGSEWYKECASIVVHLKQSSPVPDLDALTTLSDEKDFEAGNPPWEPMLWVVAT
jgi:hypothetical protein